MNQPNNLNNVNEKNIEKVYKLIGEAEDITITTHINPDGDALGSAIALYYYLLSKGKKPCVCVFGEIPYNMEFLPGIDFVINYEKTPVYEKIVNSGLIFVVDLNDLSRLRELSNAIRDSKAPKIVIDHHINPQDFADVYVVNPDASSTGEIIWKVLEFDKDFRLTKEIAELLYVAIMTDTGSFRFPRTTGDLHRIIAGLIDAGADPVSLYENVYNNNPFRTIKLLGEAFSGMELYHDGKLCLMKITAEMFERTGSVEDDIENFVEKTLSIRGVKIGILMSEIKSRNEIRISFRSKGEYDSRSLAVSLGGGGHYHAAGARVYGKEFNKLAKELIEAAGRILK